MPQPITIFRGTMGLNNVIDPARIVFDPRSGMIDLAAGYNVDIDDTGRPGRRKGFTSVLGSNSHSLYGWGGSYALFVTGDALSVLHADYTATEIRNVREGARMSYAEVAGSVYYANNHEKGVVKDEISYEWVDEDYIGPTTHKVFYDPPIGHLLEQWNGRMLVAKDDVVWYSEPFAYGRFRKASNYIPLSSRARMVKGVKGGVFTSDETATYFHPGQDAAGLGSVKVADYPAIEGTEKVISGSKIGSGGITDRCVIWTSTKGICLGGPEGFFKNLTERRLTYPIAIRGTGYDFGNRYVCTLEP